MKNLKIRKRLLSLLAAGTIVLSTGGFMVANADYTAQDDQVITTDGVNVRMGDYVEATRIGGLELNTIVDRILTTENGWDLVRYNGNLGFVSGDYTQELAGPSNNPLYSYEQMSTEGITLDGVNLRSGPSTDYDLELTIPKDSYVDVLGKSNNGWYLITYNEKVGFIRGDFLKLLSYDVNSDYSLTNEIAKVIPVVKATTSVKVRESATAESKQLDLLREGYTLKNLGKMDNGWYKVELPTGEIGYVSGSYVVETIGVEGNFYKVVALTRDTYLYDAPNGNVIDTVGQYQSGQVYAQDNGYLLISTYDNQTGYVKKDDTKTLTSTAVVVDISTQTLIVYKDNQIVLTAPVVTGRDTPERQSDLGLFQIYSKETERYLTDGETYNSFVNYWMPYNRGEGLHDATWRSRFGGEIYKSNGSHGCVNMPLDMAKDLYGIVSVGDNVLVKR